MNNQSIAGTRNSLRSMLRSPRRMPKRRPHSRSEWAIDCFDLRLGSGQLLIDFIQEEEENAEGEGESAHEETVEDDP